jgi:DNA polymerase-3 subunit delta'
VAVSRIFPELFGNDAVKERLGRAILSDRLPHALILSGPEGSGRRTLARLIAAALVCERKGEDVPCGKCENCRRVREGIFPDLHRIRPDEGKSLIPVAKIREMRAEMSLSAVEAGRRIFIIENADGMNTAAQNALLISLEEPPDGVYILLIAESEEVLLSTVRSRAQSVKTELFETDELRRYLARDPRFTELEATAPSRASALLEGARGTVGGALALLGGDLLTDVLRRRELVDAIVDALAKRGAAPLYEALRPLGTGKREEVAEQLCLLTEALRDLILLKRDPTCPLIYYYERETAQRTADELGIRRLLSLSDAANEAIEDLGRNANVAVVLSTLLYAALH